METLKEKISLERKKYFDTYLDFLRSFVFNSNDFVIWKFQVSLRKSEYFREKVEISKFYLLPFLFYRRRKNSLGRRLGFDIPEGCFATGLKIFHISSIVVNSNARIGKNCTIVGNVCIGNVKGQKKAPQIGDNCMFGWGSVAIGEIRISDNCQLAAGAVVVRDVKESNTVMLGFPAKDKQY